MLRCFDVLSGLVDCWCVCDLFAVLIVFVVDCCYDWLLVVCLGYGC